MKKSDQPKNTQSAAAITFRTKVWQMGNNTAIQISPELTARGVRLLNGPMDCPWGIRTASFADPAGHIWEIAK